MNLFQGEFNVTGFNSSSRLTLKVSPASSNSDTQSNLGLPPSSLMSFLSKRNIPGIVFSDYESQFSNPYYHSELDSNSPWTDLKLFTLMQVIFLFQ